MGYGRVLLGSVINKWRWSPWEGAIYSRDFNCSGGEVQMERCAAGKHGGAGSNLLRNVKQASIF